MTIKSIFHRLRSSASLRQSHPLNDIYKRFINYTMVPREWYITNLSLAQRVSHIQGSVVECGVWRGGMIAGVASLLGPNRNYFLFDSFEGLPPAKEIDGQSAIEWQSNKDSPKYYDNCRANKESASEAMRLSGVTSFTVNEGWFHETLPSYPANDQIALLRLDGDWYDSTMVCLKNLYDRVIPAGIIIIDDYHTWDGCSRAVHDFLSERSAIERINCLNGVCFITKLSDSPNHHKQ